MKKFTGATYNDNATPATGTKPGAGVEGPRHQGARVSCAHAVPMSP